MTRRVRELASVVDTESIVDRATSRDPVAALVRRGGWQRVRALTGATQGAAHVSDEHRETNALRADLNGINTRGPHSVSSRSRSSAGRANRGSSSWSIHKLIVRHAGMQDSATQTSMTSILVRGLRRCLARVHAKKFV